MKTFLILNSKYTKLVLFLNFLLLSITHTNSSLIFESKPNSLILQEFKNEILQIQKSQSMAKLDLGTYTFQDKALGTVEISEIKQEMQYFEVNTLSLTIKDNNDQTLTGKEGPMKLQYSFNYKKSSELQDKGTFTLDSTKYTVTKSFKVNEDKILQQNGTVNQIEFNSNEIKYNGDDSLKQLIEAAIKEMTTWITPQLLDAYNKDFSDFYANTSNARNVIKFITNSPELNCTLDLTYDKIPVKLGDDNVLYYLSGNLNNHKDVDRQPQFDKDTAYQVLIHRDIFNNLFSDMTKDGLMDFSLTKDNRPPKTPFYLNIQSLGQIIPELYNLYPRDEEFKAYSKISNYEIIKAVSDKLSGFITISTDIILLNDMSNLFSFETRFTFNINTSLNTFNLNFYVDDLNVKAVSIKLVNSKFKRVDKDTLMMWTEATLKSILSSKFYLLNEPFDLSKYFNQISEIKCNQNGCILKGTGKIVNFNHFIAEKEISTNSELNFLS